MDQALTVMMNEVYRHVAADFDQKFLASIDVRYTLLHILVTPSNLAIPVYRGRGRQECDDQILCSAV